jgi:hypothetical protein
VHAARGQEGRSAKLKAVPNSDQVTCESVLFDRVFEHMFHIIGLGGAADVHHCAAAARVAAGGTQVSRIPDDVRGRTSKVALAGANTNTADDTAAPKVRAALLQPANVGGVTCGRLLTFCCCSVLVQFVLGADIEQRTLDILQLVFDRCARVYRVIRQGVYLVKAHTERLWCGAHAGTLRGSSTRCWSCGRTWATRAWPRRSGTAAAS